MTRQPVLRTATVPALLFAALVSPLSGCSESEPTTPPGNAPVASVRLGGAVGPLGVGSIRTMSVVVTDASGNILTGRPVMWSSSDASVLHVAEDGRISALRAGVADVRATVEGVTDALQTIVTQDGLVHNLLTANALALPAQIDSFPEEQPNGETRLIRIRVTAGTVVFTEGMSRYATDITLVAFRVEADGSESVVGMTRWRDAGIATYEIDQRIMMLRSETFASLAHALHSSPASHVLHYRDPGNDTIILLEFAVR